MIIRATKRLVAYLLGRKVNFETAQERQFVCARCDLVKYINQRAYCGICGCHIMALSQYRERLPMWGCKHPKRDLGLGWPPEPH